MALAALELRSVGVGVYAGSRATRAVSQEVVSALGGAIGEVLEGDFRGFPLVVGALEAPGGVDRLAGFPIVVANAGGGDVLLGGLGVAGVGFADLAFILCSHVIS